MSLGEFLVWEQPSKVGFKSHAHLGQFFRSVCLAKKSGSYFPQLNDICLFFCYELSVGRNFIGGGIRYYVRN